MQNKIKCDGVDWAHYDLTTGELIKKGRAYFTNSNRLIGPGVNNVLISRLKKGEDIDLEFPSLNVKATFRPVKSAW